MKIEKTNHPQIEIKAYNFEIYTKNKETGERGWDIKVGYVFANNQSLAETKVKEYFGRDFDCFISIAQIGTPADLLCTMTIIR